MLTIKQLADKLGVSKPTITRNKPEHLEFEVIEGVNYINENMERQITEKVLQNKERYSSDTRNEKDDAPLVQQLLQENAFLRAQIEEKDALIKEQTKLLDQQQQLNLITGKRLNELETKEQTETEEQQRSETVTENTVSEEKKGFFSRIFGN